MGKLQQVLSKLFLKIGWNPFKWKKQQIPNNAILFRRVHYSKVYKDVQRNNNYVPNPSNFTDKELSCDWKAYTSAEQILERTNKEYKFGTQIFKDSNDFFVCSISVQGIIDNALNQEIRHDPIQNIPEVTGTPNNRAHSLVIGEKHKEEEEQVRIRFWLSKLSKWEIFNESIVEKLRSKQNRKK